MQPVHALDSNNLPVPRKTAPCTAKYGTNGITVLSVRAHLTGAPYCTTHNNIANLDLENPSDLAQLSDPVAFFNHHPRQLVILDEVQRAPGLFAVLRCGFPNAYLARSDAASMRWRQQFITTYLERDIPLLGPRIPAQTLRNFWTMLSYEQGQMLNAARLAASLGVSGQTIARYLDLMCDLLLVRRLQPWARQSSKRLVKSPKVYVRDSGLVHALLGLDSLRALLAYPVVGGSWEGFVVESLLACTPHNTLASYYRTGAGAEIDLLLELPGGALWAIEIKRSSAPTLSKGFYLGCDDVGATRRLVVSQATTRFPIPHGVEHVPLQALMQELWGLRKQAA